MCLKWKKKNQIKNIENHVISWHSRDKIHYEKFVELLADKSFPALRSAVACIKALDIRIVMLLAHLQIVIKL